MDGTEVLGARLIQKFKGVTHALEHQYLRELILVVSASEDDENDAIEMYTWRLRYDSDGEPHAEFRQQDGTVMAALRFRGMQFLKKQVTELLLMIRTLCRGTLTPLPPGACATLRLTYTDRTPKGYQAPGFYRSPEDPVLRSDAQEIDITSLQTRYHGCAIVVQSVFIDDAYAVGMRMKENLRFTSLNDSLNETMDEGAGDEGSRSANNDTIERISDPAGPQDEAVEIPRKLDETSMSRSSPVMSESTISKTTRLSVAADRGSPAELASSGSATPEDMPPKRQRRGRARLVQQQVQKGSKSPVIVSRSPKIVDVASNATPPRKADTFTYDTPPARKTPGFSKMQKVTPKDAPRRRGR